MQFTGLHDKNGVEIYEGDIVLADDQNEHFDTVFNEEKDEREAAVRCEVVWTTAGFWLRSKDEPDGVDLEYSPWNVVEFEVVGNIHENPDLLG